MGSATSLEFSFSLSTRHFFFVVVTDDITHDHDHKAEAFELDLDRNLAAGHKGAALSARSCVITPTLELFFFTYS